MNGLTSPTTTNATASPFGPLKIVRNLSLKRMRGSSSLHEKVRLLRNTPPACCITRQVTGD